MDTDEDFAVGSEELLDDEFDNESVRTLEERHVDAQGASGAGSIRVQARRTTDTGHPIEYDDASSSPENVTTQRRASDGPCAVKQPLATHGTSQALVDKAQADLLWTSPMTPGPSAAPHSHEQPEAWQGSKSQQGQLEGLAHAPAHQRRHHQQQGSPWRTSMQASSGSPSHPPPTLTPTRSSTVSIGNSSPASGRSGLKLSPRHKTTPSGQSTPGQAIGNMPHIAASCAPSTTGAPGRSCAVAAGAGSPSGSAMRHSPLTTTPPSAPWAVRPSAALAKLRAWSTAAQAAHDEQVRAMVRMGGGANDSSNSGNNGSKGTGGRGDGAHDQGCRAKQQDDSLVQGSSSVISRGTPAWQNSANPGRGGASPTPHTTHTANAAHAMYSYQTTPQKPAPLDSAKQYTLHMQSHVHCTLLHSGSHLGSAAQGHKSGGSRAPFKVDAATRTTTGTPGSGGGTEGVLPLGEGGGLRGSSRRSLLHVLEGAGGLGEEDTTHERDSLALDGHGGGGLPAAPGLGGVGEGGGGMSHAGGHAGSPTVASRHRHTRWVPPDRLASCDEPTPDGAHPLTPTARVTHHSPGALSLQLPPTQPQPAAHPPYHPPAPRSCQEPTWHTTAHMPTPPRPTPTTPSSAPRAAAPTQGGGIPSGDVPACPLSDPGHYRPPDGDIRQNMRGDVRGYGGAAQGSYSTGTPAASMRLGDHHHGGGSEAMAGHGHARSTGGGRSRSSAEVMREADDVLAAARQQVGVAVGGFEGVRGGHLTPSWSTQWLVP